MNVALRAIVAASLLLVMAVPPVQGQGQETATIRGGILDPSGEPAVGFRTVVRDLASDREYRSRPSNESGEYVLEVPAGTRYLLLAVIAPDGTVLPVQSIPPLPVRVEGTYQLDVHFRFLSGEPGEKVPELAPGVEAPEERPAPAPAGKDISGTKPWYKRPSGVIGIVAGVGVVAAAAGGGGGDSGTTSPSAPP
jgi:hypothetical protein